MELGQLIIAGISAAFGGAGVKLVESLMARYRRRIDSTSQIRQELRDELESLRYDNSQLIDEVDVWKRKYFEILQELNNMKLELTRMRIKLNIDPEME